MKTSNVLDPSMPDACALWAKITMEPIWKVRVWDGNSTTEYFRNGTYEQVVNSLSGLPPGYIWSVS